MQSLIESVLGLDPGEVHAAARLRDELGVDYLDLLELVLAMEAELGVQIPDRALEDVTTVDDLIGVAGIAVAPTRSRVALHPAPKPALFRLSLRRATMTP